MSCTRYADWLRLGTDVGDDDSEEDDEDEDDEDEDDMVGGKLNVAHTSDARL